MHLTLNTLEVKYAYFNVMLADRK